MQVDAEARRFDVIIVEALDRLSRKLADVADLHDRLTFLGIKLHAVNAGEISFAKSMATNHTN
jgi:site-specific DNA recombinase